MSNLGQQTLSPKTRLAEPDARLAGSAAPGPSGALQECAGANALQWQWDLGSHELALFLRDRDGRDAVEPHLVCTLDEWLTCVLAGDRDGLRDQLLSLSRGAARSFEAQFRMSLGDGRQQWHDLCGIVVRDEQATPRHIIAQQTRLEVGGHCGKSSRLPSPFHDALTGLPNRWLFERCLGWAIEAARREEGPRFALLFVDLDSFKAINDSHGHLLGDSALLAVVQRFAHCVRPDDVVARRDGDEFTVLLKNVWRHDDVTAVAHRILHHLRAPLVLDGIELQLTASIGIALSWTGSLAKDDLLRSADKAMYGAKARGGDCWLVAERMGA